MLTVLKYLNPIGIKLQQIALPPAALGGTGEASAAAAAATNRDAEFPFTDKDVRDWVNKYITYPTNRWLHDIIDNGNYEAILQSPYSPNLSYSPFYTGRQQAALNDYVRRQYEVEQYLLQQGMSRFTEEGKRPAIMHFTNPRTGETMALDFNQARQFLLDNPQYLPVRQEELIPEDELVYGNIGEEEGVEVSPSDDIVNGPPPSEKDRKRKERDAIGRGLTDIVHNPDGTITGTGSDGRRYRYDPDKPDPNKKPRKPFFKDPRTWIYGGLNTIANQIIADENSFGNGFWQTVGDISTWIPIPGIGIPAALAKRNHWWPYNTPETQQEQSQQVPEAAIDKSPITRTDSIELEAMGARPGVDDYYMLRDSVQNNSNYVFPIYRTHPAVQQQSQDTQRDSYDEETYPETYSNGDYPLIP